MLINQSAVRDFIREKSRRLRGEEFAFRRVSAEALEKIDARVRAILISEIRNHPTIGATFKL